MINKYTILSSIFIVTSLESCLKEKEIELREGPIPYELDIPSHFPPVEIPIENPLTVEGIELGRHLFWDTRMSRNNTISCATCHAPQYAFSDNIPFSYINMFI